MSVNLEALADRRGDAGGMARLEGAVHEIVRRYCRALIGRAGGGFAAADALADDLARRIMCKRCDEFGGPVPAEAIVYSDMAPVVARALRDQVLRRRRLLRAGRCRPSTSTSSSAGSHRGSGRSSSCGRSWG